MYNIYSDIYNDYLMHHGVKGMKWGVRRYQNKDGSLTNAGRKRLAKDIIKRSKTDKTNGKYDTVDYIANKFKSNRTSEIQSSIDLLRKKYDAYGKIVKKAPLDYEDTEQYRRDVKKAHNETIKDFKRNQPDVYKNMLKQVNGNTHELDRFHDFRKRYDGYLDSISSKGSKIYEQQLKAKGYDRKAEEKAYNDYVSARDEVGKTIAGKYGSKKLSNLDKSYWWIQPTVQSTISDALNKIVLEERR